MSRQQVFEREVTEYDERQLPKVLDFKEHRFVSIERDSVSGVTFVRGHKSMRGACNYLAGVVEGCERFVPQKLLDLDTGEMHELDVFAFVAPKSVDAVAVMMPRNMAETVAGCLKSWPQLDSVAAAVKLIEHAIERRSR